MYMTIPQLEQLLKDRQDSAMNSARTANNHDWRKLARARLRRVRTASA